MSIPTMTHIARINGIYRFLFIVFYGNVNVNGNDTHQRCYDTLRYDTSLCDYDNYQFGVVSAFASLFPITFQYATGMTVRMKYMVMSVP